MKQKTSKKKPSSRNTPTKKVASKAAASPPSKAHAVKPPVPPKVGDALRVSVPPPIPPKSARHKSSGDHHPPPSPVRMSAPPPVKSPMTPDVDVDVDVLDVNDSENDPTLIQIELDDASVPPPVHEKPATDAEKKVPPPKAPPLSKAAPKASPPPKTAPATFMKSTTKPKPPISFEPTMELSIEFPPPADAGKIPLPPSEPRKEPRPSPEVLIEALRRCVSAKSEKGIGGPGGDAVDRAKSIIAACEGEVSSITDKPRSARLHFEAAQCYELFIDDESKALQHYQKSLELMPELLPALRGARRLQMTQKNYPAALKLLETEIELQGEPKYKALLHCVKGRIYEDFLHQQTKARQSYQKALELSPGTPWVIETLKQVEQKAKNWPGTIDLAVQAADAISADPKYRAVLIAERARLLDTRTKNAAAAAEAYSYAMRTDLEVQGVRGPLKRLLYTQARWQELIELWERDIAASRDPEARSSALLHVAGIYAERLGDRGKAVETLERAHRGEPANLAILEALITHYELMQLPERIIDTLKRTAGLVPPDYRRAAIFHRIGTLYEKEGDLMQAVSWYEETLRLQPDHIPSLRAVTGLYERLERWDALTAVYLAEASSTENTARRAEAHVKAAAIFETRLNRPQDAVSHYAAAISLVPGLETSFKALVRLYAQAQMYKPLIELYESAVDRAKDDDTLFTYLFKIGALYEDALGRPDLAVDVYRRVLKRSPKHLGAVHAVQRTAESSGRMRDLLDALELESEIVKDPKRHVEILQAAARCADEKLGDTEVALSWYKKVLDEDPAYAPALAGIGGLYYRLEKWKELLDVYSQELKSAESDEERISLLTKMAELCVYRIGDDTGAVKYYRRAVELAPSDPLLMHALCTRLDHKGDFDTLTAVLQSSLGNTDQASERARISVRIAEIHENNRKDGARAAEAYKKALEDVPSYRPALDGLIRVQGALGNWSELAEQLVQDAESATDPNTAMEDLLQAAVITNDHLGDTKRAVAVIEKVLTREPANLAALLTLSPMLRELGSQQKLIEVYVRLSSELQDAGEKNSVFKELARLVEAHGDSTELGRVLMAALAGDPRDPSVTSAMEQTAAAKKDWALLAEADMHSAAAAGAPELSAIYLARLGNAMESSSPREAADAFAAASQFDPDGLAVLRAMAVIGEKIGDPDIQIEALRREADWTRSGKKSADILARCADLRLRLKRDMNGATADLATALYRHPEHAEAASHIESLLRNTNHLETLIEILSRAAEMTRDGAKKAEYWGKVAELYSDGRRDVSGAISALNRMLAAQPTHVPTLMHLSNLYKQNRQWDEAVKTLERAAKQRPNRKVLVEIHLECARIAMSHLSNASFALSNLDALLQLEPSHAEALSLLCDAHFKKGNLDSAATAAEKLLKASNDDESRAAALFFNARVRFQKNAKKSAAKSFREAVALAGPAKMAAPEYLSLLGNEEPWEEYLNALGEYQKKVSAMPGNEAGIAEALSEIARVQHEGLGNPDAAVAVLEQAVVALGKSSALQFELANRLAAAGQYERAVDELTGLTAEAPLNPETWRLLAQVYRAAGKEAEASAAVAPLTVLPGGRELLPFDPSYTTGHAAPGSLGRPALTSLTPRLPGLDALAGLLSTLGDALAKVYSPNLEQYGLSTRERLADTHPLHIVSNAAAAAFGVQAHDLYLSSGTDEIQVELTQPVSIIVPDRLRSASQAQQVFALSRVFAYITRDLQGVLRLGPAETRLTAAAVTQKFSSALSGTFDADALERQSKRIYKAVSWRAKKGVEEAASLLASSPGVDPAQCLYALETAAVRPAALIAQDLSAVSDELSKIVQERDQFSRIMNDLLSFWASDTAFAVRRAARIS